MDNGPYFEGQTSSSACGHYYPDVVRLRDYVGDGNKVYRVIECCHCGESEIQIAEYTCGHYQPGQVLDPVDDSTREERDKWRAEERERLRSKRRSD